MQVYGMRILGPNGGASFWILEAFDAVAELAASGRIGPAIVSGSFGGPCGSSDVECRAGIRSAHVEASRSCPRWFMRR